MKKENNRKNIPAAVQIAMPFLLTVFCSAVIVLAMTGPADKIKGYYNIAFMDDNKTIPQSSGIAGLNIVETDIDTDYSGSVSSEGRVILAEYGSQYAVLECKSLSIFVPVYWGLGSELLEHGAVNSPSSALIGAEGNTVISAHVNSFFSNLDEIKEGDEVVLYTDYGRFTYKVRTTAEFRPDDKKYIRMTEDDILTLYTCVKSLPGEDNGRFAAVCDLVKREFYTSPEVSD